MLIAVAIGVSVTACGSDDEPAPLSWLVLPGPSLPDGFLLVSAPLETLLSANSQTLEQAKTVEFTPPQCAPTADAEFTPQLTEANAALLVAESDTATLSEIVTTVPRNLDADRRATTGPCRVVTAVPTKGTLAGAQIVTSSRELTKPGGENIEQALVLRSDSVTTLVDGQFRVRSALLGTALVRRPTGEQVTVSLNVATRDARARAEEPAEIAPPMGEGEYLELFGEAIKRVTG